MISLYLSLVLSSQTPLQMNLQVSHDEDQGLVGGSLGGETSTACGLYGAHISTAETTFDFQSMADCTMAMNQAFLGGSKGTDLETWGPPGRRPMVRLANPALLQGQVQGTYSEFLGVGQVGFVGENSNLHLRASNCQRGEHDLFTGMTLHFSPQECGRILSAAKEKGTVSINLEYSSTSTRGRHAGEKGPYVIHHWQVGQ